MAQRYGIYKAPSMDNLNDEESVGRLHGSVELVRKASQQGGDINPRPIRVPSPNQYSNSRLSKSIRVTSTYGQ